METKSIYTDLFSETELFYKKFDLDKKKLPEVRTFRTKKMSGEVNSDKRINLANYR